MANLPKHTRLKLINKAKKMLGVARKCKEMLREIKKADFRKKVILNERTLDYFSKNAAVISSTS